MKSSAPFYKWRHQELSPFCNVIASHVCHLPLVRGYIIAMRACQSLAFARCISFDHVSFVVGHFPDFLIDVWWPQNGIYSFVVGLFMTLFCRLADISGKMSRTKFCSIFCWVSLPGIHIFWWLLVLDFGQDTSKAGFCSLVRVSYISIWTEGEPQTWIWCVLTIRDFSFVDDLRGKHFQWQKHKKRKLQPEERTGQDLCDSVCGVILSLHPTFCFISLIVPWEEILNSK